MAFWVSEYNPTASDRLRQAARQRTTQVAARRSSEDTFKESMGPHRSPKNLSSSASSCLLFVRCLFLLLHLLILPRPAQERAARSTTGGKRKRNVSEQGDQTSGAGESKENLKREADRRRGKERRRECGKRREWMRNVRGRNDFRGSMETGGRRRDRRMMRTVR